MLIIFVTNIIGSKPKLQKTPKIVGILSFVRFVIVMEFEHYAAFVRFEWTMISARRPAGISGGVKLLTAFSIDVISYYQISFT
jgi:hypothetical protein